VWKAEFAHDTQRGIWGERKRIHEFVKDLQAHKNVCNRRNVLLAHCPAFLSQESLAVCVEETSEKCLGARISQRLIQLDGIE
jgi:hypothetical protein